MLAADCTPAQALNVDGAGLVHAIPPGAQAPICGWLPIVGWAQPSAAVDCPNCLAALTQSRTPGYRPPHGQ
jgi:hypothetical protein